MANRRMHAGFALALDGKDTRVVSLEISTEDGDTSCREIRLSAFRLTDWTRGRYVADVVVGLDDSGELRILVTTDGDGEQHHGIAVYPERAGPLAIEVIEEADDLPRPTRSADSPRVR